MCIFCKLANKEIDTEIVYEDDDVFAFKDSNPQAPVHILFIPKKHIESLNDINEENKDIIGKIYLAINKVVKDLGIDKEGYRVVTNTGELGGQSVMHLHFHLLGGRQMEWPRG